MNSGVTAYFESAKRFGLTAWQSVQIFEQKQQQLGLEHVLSPARIQSAEGVSMSRITLDKARELAEERKAHFQQVMLDMTAEVTTILASIAEPLHTQYKESFINSINWQLNMQNKLYLGRLRWVEACQTICDLLDSKREQIVFSEDGVIFPCDADYDLFDAQMAIIEQVHLSEVAQQQETFERMKASLAIMSLPQHL